MSLLALHCGLRFGEIARLTWEFVDFEEGALTIIDSKNKSKTRAAFMTARVEEMPLARKAVSKGDPNLVFPSEKGTVQTDMSKTFSRTPTNLLIKK